ncbi:MAG: GTPase HflX [Chlamydiia bacterium]|nr:GTPase HflX [Chlamydiia bacterium]
MASMTEKDKAYLIATFSGASDRESCQEHLAELAFLADTYGVEVIAEKACPLRRVDPATFLGSGKLEELVSDAKALGAKLVIFDEEMSPAQQRNLEEAFGITVMDRTELILGVFEQRAQSKEARLQVELAETRYQIPRLKRLWTHLHRQTGSGKSGQFVKGEGEKQIELDRRILKNRISLLEKEIAEVEKHRQVQRQQRVRKEVPVFALIGYTNVGKSTLLNALTDAGVFVEDKLFATLDTTTRKFTLPTNQEILLIDTVGFIRKLPHLLVAAFKGTLEESMQADILLHLIDVSHPYAEDQAEASYEVLKELNAEEKPVITVLNKVDKLEDPSKILYFRTKYPRCVPISALNKEGFNELLEAMVDELRKTRRLVWLRIPQSDYAAVSEVMEKGIIFHQDYEENDILLRCELPASLAGRLKKYEFSS